MESGDKRQHRKWRLQPGKKTNNHTHTHTHTKNWCIKWLAPGDHNFSSSMIFFCLTQSDFSSQPMNRFWYAQQTWRVFYRVTRLLVVHKFRLLHHWCYTASAGTKDHSSRTPHSRTKGHGTYIYIDIVQRLCYSDVIVDRENHDAQSSNTALACLLPLHNTSHRLPHQACDCHCPCVNTKSQATAMPLC